MSGASRRRNKRLKSAGQRARTLQSEDNYRKKKLSRSVGPVTAANYNESRRVIKSIRKKTVPDLTKWTSLGIKPKGPIIL